MSQNKLAAAREFIQERNYEVARAILETMIYDETAMQWLARLNQISPKQVIPHHNQYPVSQRPIQYAYKSITVRKNIWRSLDNEAEPTINKMVAEGWELVSQQDSQPKDIFGGTSMPLRTLHFRRPI